MLRPKRISVFTGHYGSGKTEVSVNYAIWLRETTKKDVVLIDMDIVNPFFRSSDAADMLAEHGVRLIASVFAGSAVENPSLPPEINSVFDDGECFAVFDVGGGDDGAVPLGRYRSRFCAEDCDMFFVLNERRPMTHSADGAIEEFYDLERASGLKYTGIINNTHLKGLTTARNILDGYSLAEEVSKRCGLPICFSSGTPDALAGLPDGFTGERFPLKLRVT